MNSQIYSFCKYPRKQTVVILPAFFFISFRVHFADFTGVSKNINMPGIPISILPQRNPVFCI